MSFTENMKEVESVQKEISVTEGEGQHGQGESTTTAEGAPEAEDGGCGDPAVHAGVKCEVRLIEQLPKISIVTVNMLFTVSYKCNIQHNV